MKWRWLLRAALGVLLVAWLLTGVTEIRPGERAVVRRFGRVLDVQPRAGWWVGFPWGIDRVDRVAVEQVRRVSVGFRPQEGGGQEETPAGQLLTGDHNLVNVQVVLTYTVDPEAVVDYVIHRDGAEGLLARLAEAVLAEWVAGRPVDEVLQRGRAQLPAALLERLPMRLAPYRLGIRLRGVDVAELMPPDEVKPAFDEVAQARARSQTLIEQAKEDAQKKQIDAAIALRQDREKTRAYLANRPEEARAEAAAFEARLGAYRANPLVREAGRWAHLVRMLSRLGQTGGIAPLDPDIVSPLPWQK